MARSKLIGKEVTITTKDSWVFGEWGIVKMYDGEYYHIAILGDEKCLLIFERKEFKVNRARKFKVKVYDNGYVNLCEMVDGEWKDSVFSTKEEADKALADYQAVWHRAGYVYEVRS